jgi:hypothetical protein
MQYTLLKMTQLILSAMDSDEVNSIHDTTEALQVVDQIETTYYDLVTTLDFPDMWDFFELEPSLDLSKPTLLKLPKRVVHVDWLRYDISEPGNTVRKMKDIIPMEPKMFFDRMDSLNSGDPDVYSYNLLVGAATFDIRGYNDRSPTYYTSQNDQTIIFDNYDASHSSTIVGNRTKGYGQMMPLFEREDNFIPQLEPRQFSLFFNEAKSACFTDLKQYQNPKAEARARRGWVQAHRKTPQMKLRDTYQATSPARGRNR